MTNKQTHPKIFLLAPRNHDFLGAQFPNYLGPLLRKKFECSQMDVTLCYDDKPAEAVALLRGQKFDAVLYICSEVWEEGRGGTMLEQVWSILEGKHETQNADTPTMALTICPAEADIERMHALGVSRVFETRNDLTAARILQAVRGEITPAAVL